MQLSHRMEGQKVIISIVGNIALDGVSDVKSYLKPLLENTSIEGYVINFEKVNFIDSSGIGLIVSFFKTIQNRQGKMALCNLSKKNLEIFSMTRLDKILPIFENETEATNNV